VSAKDIILRKRNKLIQNRGLITGVTHFAGVVDCRSQGHDLAGRRASRLVLPPGFWVPTVRTAKDFFRCNPRGFGLRQLP
jgi:hypothetical protein